jgi:hypothetical protein
MAPTLPGYKIWEYYTPLTVAASPLLSPWFDTTGYTQVVPAWKFTGGAQAFSLDASLDGVNLDADMTTLYSAPATGTAFTVFSPFFRLHVVQTVADATVTKILLQARA